MAVQNKSQPTTLSSLQNKTTVDTKVRAWFKLFRLLVRVPVP